MAKLNENQYGAKLRKIVAKRKRKPGNPTGKTREGSGYEPTPEQIAAACRKIRETEEFERRNVSARHEKRNQESIRVIGSGRLWNGREMA